ncbi:GAF domain-containing protein [Oscillatoria sp. CS-180]|uniref:GAF domain-containing protein n=1 Tax=Oscillatoria sp. CS-180 TaxID=3021720 RepID=UPI00232D12CE|nr:GAF domain-containing protein [Oscillatoria sp. CS-180]MDB9526693.1 GAF domain-containing protein [Oscillatoria sp. CS-180]
MIKADLSSGSKPQTFGFQVIKALSQTRQIEDIFIQILPLIGSQLACDRVFVYLRSPDAKVGRVPFCWRRHGDIPEVYDPDWKSEPSDLAQHDPMFAAALAAQPSIFVRDVETASADVLNRDFERKTFGHRALIHGHLCLERQLWGVLQPCVFGKPRQWSDCDRKLIEQAVGWLTPLAMEYVNCHLLPIKNGYPVP